MDGISNCPKCNCEYTYKDANNISVCPECHYEWTLQELDIMQESELIKDAYNNVLSDGDTVMLIKDLKIKGTRQTAKQGTKVYNIKLKSGDHNIDCKMPEIGQMELKSEFVKKV